MKILVTGVTGFIGSHVAEALLARGHTVVGMDRRSGGWVGTVRANAPEGRFLFVHADIQDKQGIHAAHTAHGGLDVVAHLAAVANVPESMKDWPASAHTNAFGSACIFDACREFCIPVVYASSAAFYADDLPTGECLREDMHRFRMESPYAAEKFLLEQYAEVLSSSFDVSALGFRIFNAYGPRALSSNGHVVPCFIEAALASKPLCVHGDGSAIRDFIYVTDIAEAFADACEALATGAHMSNEVYNLCSGQSISVLSLAHRIREMIHPELQITHAGKRAGDASVLVGSPEHFIQRFGRPAATISLAQGLAHVLDWYHTRETGA